MYLKELDEWQPVSCGIYDYCHLNLDELPSTLESDLDEGIAGHVLRKSRIKPHLNALPASTWTPSCVSCMNSNSLLTTVFKNLQCALKKRGYWPTMYIILDAIIAW